MLFNHQALELMEKYKQYRGDSEAGGILLGSYRGQHIEVIYATPPGTQDIRTPNKFIRKCKSHKLAAHLNWINSNQTVTYVGEWHTHPQIVPQPSCIDYSNWNSNLPSDEIIVCIQGTQHLWAAECIPAKDNNKNILELIILPE